MQRSDGANDAAVSNHRSPQYGLPADTALWGLPIGNFGLFASALIASALGLAAFCFSCFLSILGILLWNSTGHPAINYADSYLYIALPIGIATLCVSSIALLALWIRRQVRYKATRV